MIYKQYTFLKFKIERMEQYQVSMKQKQNWVEKNMVLENLNGYFCRDDVTCEMCSGTLELLVHVISSNLIFSTEILSFSSSPKLFLFIVLISNMVDMKCIFSVSLYGIHRICWGQSKLQSSIWKNVLFKLFFFFKERLKSVLLVLIKF